MWMLCLQHKYILGRGPAWLLVTSPRPPSFLVMESSREQTNPQIV